MTTDQPPPAKIARARDMTKPRRKKRKGKQPAKWKPGESGNPAGNVSNLGSVLTKHRRVLHTAIAGKFGEPDVIEVMGAWLEHVRNRHDDKKGFGWQKSAELFMDRLLGKPKVDKEGDDDAKPAVSRVELHAIILQTFGLNETTPPNAPHEVIDGEFTTRAAKALPAGPGEAGGRDAAPGPGDAVLPLPEEVGDGPGPAEDR